MDNSASIIAQYPGESSLTMPELLFDLSRAEEHVARLMDLRTFGLIRRWDDLLDTGVAAVFGITGGEAELVGRYFHAGKITPDVRPLGSALTSTETRTPVKTQGVDMTAIMKTRDARREELKRLAATPNGIDKLYLILTRNFIPFQKLPIGTLMIEAILDHEYSEKKVI